jgi:nitrogenase molybdenum-iron protein alpha/beta subunit
MKIIEHNKAFDDRIYPGAFIGATFVASGVKNSIIIYHGYLGCNIESVHMRSDTIPGGFYTPIIATGLNENDSIYGGLSKLKDTLKEVCRRKYDIIWVLTGDATSITADDIHSLSSLDIIPAGTKLISLDVPGFLGGIRKGTDIALAKLLENTAVSIEKTNSICLVAPHLMGIKSHPIEAKEIKSLLNRCNILTEHILSKQLHIEDLDDIVKNRYFLSLCWESMPELENFCQKHSIELLNPDIPLPIGIANTEEWLLAIADIFNNREKSQNILLEDSKILKDQLKHNYNYSWLSTLYNEKTCSIYGHSQFAVSLARCFYYDFNIKPKVIAILSETEEAIEKSKRLLSDMANYTDFTLLINPDYYSYLQHINEARIDFAVGSIQDKPLCTGANIAHMSLSGFYFFNNYNFIPWPYTGITGTLSLLTELGFLMEKAFYYEKYWKNYAYKPAET